ncbi:MAG: hypothetical protein ACTS8R_07555 [Arsenophonus sp. NC-QC1-MAG3]
MAPSGDIAAAAIDNKSQFRQKVVFITFIWMKDFKKNAVTRLSNPDVVHANRLIQYEEGETPYN